MKNIFKDHEITKFIELVNQSQKIVIIPHVNPDGDAIGSALGLWHILKNFGKQAKVIVPNHFPDFLHWIKGSNETINFTNKRADALRAINQSDTMIVVDFNDFSRSEHMSDTLMAYKGKSIVIDHHPQPVAQCDLLISYPKISSSCELVYRIIEKSKLKQHLTKEAAEALFCGMMTDTGNFSYNANDSDTYRIIGDLIDTGIDKNLIYDNVFNTFSTERWRLIGHSLKEKMVVMPEYKTGFITLTKQELEKFEYQQGDTEGLVNYPLMISGIIFSVLFIEKDDHVKLSLRSKGNFSVNTFARTYFNGGGHTNAAGGKINLSLKDAVDMFVKLLPKYTNQLNK